MGDRPVYRCVCTWRTFAELKASGLTTADEIADVYGSGAQCGMCRPYIERMLLTGETEFPVYLPSVPEPEGGSGGDCGDGSEREPRRG